MDPVMRNFVEGIKLAWRGLSRIRERLLEKAYGWQIEILKMVDETWSGYENMEDMVRETMEILEIKSQTNNIFDDKKWKL